LIERGCALCSDPARDAWSFVAYALEPIPENAAWVGLSEISAVPGGVVLIERDNLSGDFARLERLVPSSPTTTASTAGRAKPGSWASGAGTAFSSRRRRRRGQTAGLACIS